jgi:hypothetical protein
MPKAADRIAKRAQKLIAQATAEDESAEAAESNSASGSSGASPPSAAGAGAELASAAGADAAGGSAAAGGDAPIGLPTGGASPEAPKEPNEQKTRQELLQERLAAVRESRREQRLGSRLKEQTAQAEADRKAAAEERSKWEALRNGTFLEGMKALGKDPRTAFEEMKEEARLAGTPEAQLAKMQERFDKQLSEIVEPLKKRVEELTEREKAAQAREVAQGIARDFEGAIADEAFIDLRVEYDDAKLFGIVQTMIEEPKLFHRHAKEQGYKLTRADGRYTMKDILSVLKAAQDEHDRGKKERSAKLRPAATQAPQVQGGQKTVNGTTDTRNAGSALGNDLASARTNGAKPPTRLTRQQRVQRLIEGG